MSQRHRKRPDRRGRLGRLARRALLFYLLVLLPLRLLLVWGFRRQSPTVINAVRAFNKRMLNPAMLRLAGRRRWYASVIRHTGRRSGREYATPVWAEPTPGGFLIPLPYGTRVDWLRNVLAAGGCTLEAKGSVYRAESPELLDTQEALPLLPSAYRVMFRLYGVRRFLRLTAQRPAPTTSLTSAQPG